MLRPTRYLREGALVSISALSCSVCMAAEECAFRDLSQETLSRLNAMVQTPESLRDAGLASLDDQTVSWVCLYAGSGYEFVRERTGASGYGKGSPSAAEWILKIAELEQRNPPTPENAKRDAAGDYRSSTLPANCDAQAEYFYAQYNACKLEWNERFALEEH